MAERFWVGDSGDWSDNTNHWSASDGGAPGASKPTSADTVRFTSNSFSTTGLAVAVAVENSNSASMDWTDATNSPTLSGNKVLYCYGNVTFIAAMSATLTSFIYMMAAGTLTAPLSVSCRFDFYSTGTMQLGSAITTTGNILHERGTVQTNNYNTSCASFGIGGTSAKTLTLGSSVITCATTWNYYGSNLTLTANTATFNVSGSFTGGGLTTYNVVNLTGATSTIAGSNTFATLALASGTTQTITFTDGTTQTITTPTLSGSSGHVHTLQGSSTGGWAITKAGGGTVTADYMNISYSTGSPANTFYAGANSWNGGNNSGWTFYTHHRLCSLGVGT